VLAYFEGSVEVQEPDGWKPATLGQNLGASQSLRLLPGANAELLVQGRRIVLNLPGEFPLGQLLQGTDTLGNVSSLVRTQVRAVLGRSAPNIRANSAAGGVRSSEAAQEEPGLSLVSSTQLIQNGKTALNLGDFQQAADLFGQAFDFAFSNQEETESAFYAGYSNLALGDAQEAAFWFDFINPVDPGSEFFVPYGLSAAQAYFELGNPVMSLEFLDRLITQTTLSGADSQFERFFRGLVMLELNDQQNARRYLSESVALDPNSPIATQVRQVLKMFD